MNPLKRLLLFLLLSGVAFQVIAQIDLRDSSAALPMLHISYGGYIPGGDFDNRFGYTSQIGGVFSYKLRSNWYFSLGGNFLFGGNVKELIADNVVDYSWDARSKKYLAGIVGEDGQVKEVRFHERGFTIPFMVGKVFPVFKKQNPNSGFFVEVGGQFIQHKVQIEVVGRGVPSLDKQNRKGYDRLTNGWGVVEGVGYRFIGNSNYLNFFIGVDLSQNFTKSFRSVHWDTGEQEKNIRMDFLYGFRLGWTFLIYKRPADKTYFY